MNLHEEQKKLQHDLAHVIRFEESNGGIFERADLYERKVEALSDIISNIEKQLLAIVKSELKDGVKEGFDPNAEETPERIEYLKNWAMLRLEKVKYEEELISAKKVLDNYNAMKQEWQDWFEERMMDCEKNFEETILTYAGINDPGVYGAILKWRKEVDPTQVKKMHFYLLMKQTIIKFRKEFNKMPKKVDKLPEMEEMQEMVGDKKPVPAE